MTPTEQKSPWTYQNEKNEMDGKTRTWACTTSDDRGGAQLCFRRIGSELNAYVTLPDTAEGGQFLCYEDACRANIRIDDKAAYSVSGRESDSGNTRIMFLPAQQLLANVKKTQTVMVEAPFFEQGKAVLHFNVQGLKF